MQARAHVSGCHLSVAESFAQLRDDLTNDNFLSALGKFAVDYPVRFDRLSLANLRENKWARNNLAALHAARTCFFGTCQLGDWKWYADKPGIALRLKTQTERRQFRLRLVVKLALYNKLNVSDLHLQFHSGDRSSFSSSIRKTISTLLSVAALASKICDHQQRELSDFVTTLKMCTFFNC